MEPLGQNLMICPARARFGGAPGGTSVGGIYGGGSTTSYGAGQSATEEWVVNAVIRDSNSIVVLTFL